MTSTGPAAARQQGIVRREIPARTSPRSGPSTRSVLFETQRREDSLPERVAQRDAGRFLDDEPEHEVVAAVIRPPLARREQARLLHGQLRAARGARPPSGGRGLGGRARRSATRSSRKSSRPLVWFRSWRMVMPSAKGAASPSRSSTPLGDELRARAGPRRSWSRSRCGSGDPASEPRPSERWRAPPLPRSARPASRLRRRRPERRSRRRPRADLRTDSTAGAASLTR